MLLAGCAASPSGAPDSTAGAAQQRLAALRVAAALPTCPSGLGPSLPDLTLPCLSGGPDVTLNRAGPGRPTLVNIWGTWCPPCVREVPLLVDLADQNAGELGVVGVLTQDTPVNGLEFARQFTMNYTSVLDDDGVVMRQFASGPPVTLFVSADGELRHVQRGEFADAAQLRQLVKGHLGIDVAGPS
jgi:thiol-disulfide isomerase/thioredoxin